VPALEDRALKDKRRVANFKLYATVNISGISKYWPKIRKV